MLLIERETLIIHCATVTFSWDVRVSENVRYVFCLCVLCGVCVHLLVQRLDLTKPHWTLRVVTDKSKAEGIEVKKDTERMDQIKSIKEAWEMVEPGRCAKVTWKLCLQ